MSIYGPVIINLKHREDRLKRIISQFETYKLKYQVCEAIYNKKDGHTGCLASHIRALEMLPEGFDAVWICEDDCELTVSPSELNEVLDAFMKSEAVGICLGYKDLMSVPFSGRFRRTFGVFSGGCYLIKRSIYDIYILQRLVMNRRFLETRIPMNTFTTILMYLSGLPILTLQIDFGK